MHYLQEKFIKNLILSTLYNKFNIFLVCFSGLYVRNLDAPVSRLNPSAISIRRLIVTTFLIFILESSEIKEAQNSMNKNKIKIVKKETFNLPIEGSLRNILVIRK